MLMAQAVLSWGVEDPVAHPVSCSQVIPSLSLSLSLFLSLPLSLFLSLSLSLSRIFVSCGQGFLHNRCETLYALLCPCVLPTSLSFEILKCTQLVVRRSTWLVGSGKLVAEQVGRRVKCIHTIRYDYIVTYRWIEIHMYTWWYGTCICMYIYIYIHIHI